MTQTAGVFPAIEKPLNPSSAAGAPPQRIAIKAKYTDPPAYFTAALEDAERLLKYAAETGVEIEHGLRNHILQARMACTTGWDEDTAANLLSGLSKLATRMEPVTAESLKSCCDETARVVVRTYWIVALCLALIIVPFSAGSFVASALSGALRTDISQANDLAVKLRSRLGAPLPNGAVNNPADPDGALITQLQQFAAVIRAIDGRARQLNILMLHMEGHADPYRSIRGQPLKIHETFQLPKGLPDWAGAAADKTMVYQDVRYFAQSLLDDVSVFYGAITVCLLPVLYARI